MRRSDPEFSVCRFHAALVTREELAMPGCKQLPLPGPTQRFEFPSENLEAFLLHSPHRQWFALGKAFSHAIALVPFQPALDAPMHF
jgi:hypothetical protein